MSYNSRRASNAHRNRRSHSGSKRRGPHSSYINPELFVKAAKPQGGVQFEPTHTFADFSMHEVLKKNVIDMGFVDPTPIQDETIPAGLAGQDIVGIANTGTGKTVAFAIPLINKLLSDKTSRALIMAPTRELAEQIEDECRKLARGSGLFSALLIGGKPMGPQLKILQRKPHIIIGTPGRIKDHTQRGTLKLDVFNIAVLDEVDRMLDMGFIGDIRDILSQTNRTRQSFFFSATLDNKVKSLIDGFSVDPAHVEVKTGDTSDHVDQNVVRFMSSGDKIDKLHDVLIKDDVSKTLVFDSTQRRVDRLHKTLQSRGFSTEAIHGGKSQGQRQRALKRFKAGEINVLVATDVAARGLDVTDITHVINYSTPQSYGDYVHRIGRAGRAGRPGFALTFVER